TAVVGHLATRPEKARDRRARAPRSATRPRPPVHESSRRRATALDLLVASAAPNAASRLATRAAARDEMHPLQRAARATRDRAAKWWLGPTCQPTPTRCLAFDPNPTASHLGFGSRVGRKLAPGPRSAAPIASRN